MSLGRGAGAAEGSGRGGEVVCGLVGVEGCLGVGLGVSLSLDHPVRADTVGTTPVGGLEPLAGVLGLLIT